MTDTWLHPRGALIRKTYRLSTGTVRFDLRWPWGIKNQGHSFWHKVCKEQQKLRWWMHGRHFGWPWEVKGQGHNALIQNILTTVTNTRLDSREDFFESSHGLSDLTLDDPERWKTNITVFDVKYVENDQNEHDFRSHRQQQPGPLAENLWPSRYNLKLTHFCIDKR